ncbi:helix-turn-helix domain-containing protein [Thalassospira xianhensis]|uniref:helix-turn-helix domain-containing protein n=1 Tax=Thalassospira xianhensis TaxID=478503 RepID=UPI000DEDABF4|nr:helix-turn-helix domain-containing protein [Thalassospira xianhensis]
MEADTGYSSDQTEVGRLLRHTRNSLGQSVEDVCRLLRIRKIYIEAIENSDYSVLPGGPYGLGFIKAYAEHLGLDGAEIVRRFRAESNAPAARTELSFPKPVQESRVPGGAVLLIAALLGIGAYGGWYYLSSQGKTIADLVDPLPERLASYTSGGEQAVPERNLENAADARAAEVGPSASAPTGEAAETAEAPAETADAPVIAQKEPAATTDTAETAAASQEVETAPAEVAEAPAEAVAPVETPAASPEVVAETTAQTPAAPAAETAAVPAAPEVDEVGGGRVFGAVNVDSRVTIEAVETSWVRIREGDGNILLTRMLSAGDTYRVPNKDGLMLEVGNAGALTYSVDGKEALPVGDYGAVISDFSLDVEALEGTASATAQ